MPPPVLGGEARGTRLLGATPLPPPGPAAPPVAPTLPEPVELLLTAPDLKMAQAQHAALRMLGAKLRRRVVLEGLGYVLSVFEPGPGQEADALLEAARARFPAAAAERNRRYDLLGATEARQYAARMVGFRDGAGTAPVARDGVRLAMLDTALDTGHPALAGRDIEVVSVVPERPGVIPPTRHGTAVASLLVGDGPVAGALPGAHLLAVGLFARDADGSLRTRTDWWLQGLDVVARARPRPAAVNLSFGGPWSGLAAAALRALYADGMRFVAAVGNGGPDSAVVFPAALPEVLAVTAVDVARNPYVEAATGPAVDIAAPGVDVWVAGEGGGVYATGTSYAAPWVTAAVARARAGGVAVVDLLAAAEDLGAPGRDPVYGAGLLRLP